MENSFQDEIIDQTYKKAVRGIIANELILQDFDKWSKYCLELPEKEQVTYTVTLLNWQVKNGGFHQYFFNSYGIFCFYTVENLKKN